jgi:hypothetical protein
MRICDFCGQNIQDEAVYCRYCQRELPPNPDLAGKHRCPTCAEWVDRGAVICPFCDHSLSTDPALGKPSRVQRLSGQPKPYDPREVLEPSKPAMRLPFRRPAEPEPDLEAEFGALEETSGMFPSIRSAPPFSEAPAEGGSLAAGPEVFRRSFWERKRDDGEAGFTPPDPFASAPAEPAAGIFGGLREPSLAPVAPRRSNPLPMILGLAVIAAVVIGGAWLVMSGRGSSILAALLPPSTSPPAIVPTSAHTGEAATPLAVAPVGTETATATSEGGCRSWETVTVENAGDRLCVYGTIKRRFVQGDIPFVAIFDEDLGTFIIVDRLGWHNVQPGDCVQATGVVEVMRGTRPLIDVQGNLQTCD